MFMNSLIIAKEFFQRIDFVFVEHPRNWLQFRCSASSIYFANNENETFSGVIECGIKNFSIFFYKYFSYRKINAVIGYFS